MDNNRNLPESGACRTAFYRFRGSIIKGRGEKDMNINLQGLGAGSQMAGALKSTRQKMERQEKCTNQVSFLEKQKDNLKNIKCDSLEEIARKLEMFHSYEDQIAAAKKEFNLSQMMHALDEAREQGEKIAEEAEKTAPKTPEERRKDMQEEAAGTEENRGVLSEVLEEILEESVEEIEEKLEETLEESVEDTGETLTELPEDMKEMKDMDETPDEARTENGEILTESARQTEISGAAGQETRTELMNGRTEQTLQMQNIISEPFKYQHFDQMA